MNTNSLRSRYEQLKSEIHAHNYRYHVLDAPVISDLEFDKLLNELKRIEAEYPDWVTPDSPTHHDDPVTSVNKFLRFMPFGRLRNESPPMMGDDIGIWILFRDQFDRVK